VERELSELDRQPVIRFEFFDTPGDEVAPGSNKVGKDFEHQRLLHGGLLAGILPAISWILGLLLDRSQRAMD
jgi:hypothetical protein